MRLIVLRATASKSTRALVVISPASTTRLSFTSVSAATRERVSWARIASRTASEIWSATLSGCPSDTDSEVKRKSLIACALLGSWGRPQGYQKLASNPEFSPAGGGDSASARAARSGIRPRVGDVWDVPHLPTPLARQPRTGRARQRCHAPRRNRGGGPDDRRAAGAVVLAAHDVARPGEKRRGRGRRARGARCRQSAAVPDPAPRLLRNQRAIRRAPRADHGPLPRAEARLARAADARGPHGRQPASCAGGPVGRAGTFSRARARRSGGLPARPGAGAGRGRVDGILRQAGLHHDAGGAARRAAQCRHFPRLRAAPAERCGLQPCLTSVSKKGFF